MSIATVTIRTETSEFQHRLDYQVIDGIPRLDDVVANIIDLQPSWTSAVIVILSPSFGQGQTKASNP